MSPTVVVFHAGGWIPLSGDPQTPPSNLAPTAPASLTVTPTSTSAGTVSWTAATDPDGTVANYQVMLNGTIVQTVTGLTTTLTGLTAATSYSVAVRAIDNEGQVGPNATATLVTLSTGDGWPDATNTGYLGSMGALTTQGYTSVTVNGTTFTNRRFTDTVAVSASNVTFQNCVFEAGYFGIDQTSGTGMLVEDCTFIGGLNCGLAVGSGTTVRRCNIYGGYDGMKISGDNIIVQDNYIHDLFTGEGAHNDGIQASSGDNWQILHNRIESPDTSCLAMFYTQGVWDDVLIQDNYLTGPGYPLYLGGTDATNVRVLNNTFNVWGFGPATDWAPGQVGNVWSGNVRAVTGAPVSP